MKTRAQIEPEMLMNVGGLVLLFILIVGLVFGLIRLVGSGDENKELSTTYSFLTLASVISNYATSATPFEPQQPPIVHPIQITDDFIVVGFSKGTDPVYEGCGPTSTLGQVVTQGSPVEGIPRPIECGENACLCLYRQTAGYDDFGQDSSDPDKMNKPIACKDFPNVDYLLSFWYYDVLTGKPAIDAQHSDIPVTQDAVDTFLGQCFLPAPDIFEQSAPFHTMQSTACIRSGQAKIASSLVLYGKCGTGKSFGTKTVYVDKMVQNGKTYVLVSAPIATAEYEARKKLFAETGGTP